MLCNHWVSILELRADFQVSSSTKNLDLLIGLGFYFHFGKTTGNICKRDNISFVFFWFVKQAFIHHSFLCVFQFQIKIK